LVVIHLRGTPLLYTWSNNTCNVFRSTLVLQDGEACWLYCQHIIDMLTSCTLPPAYNKCDFLCRQVSYLSTMQLNSFRWMGWTLILVILSHFFIHPKALHTINRVGLGCQIGPGDLVMSGPHYRAFDQMTQNPEAQPQTFIWNVKWCIFCLYPA